MAGLVTGYAERQELVPIEAGLDDAVIGHDGVRQEKPVGIGVIEQRAAAERPQDGARQIADPALRLGQRLDDRVAIPRGEQIGVARGLQMRAGIDGDRVGLQRVAGRVHVTDRDHAAGEPVKPRDDRILVLVVSGIATRRHIEVAERLHIGVG